MSHAPTTPRPVFPFLFGGTFIEGFWDIFLGLFRYNFPSFSEGLSLRVEIQSGLQDVADISLPFRRDFH